MSATTGVRTIHSKACSATHNGRCRCKPSYQAAVHDSRNGKRVRRNFKTLAEARAWRAEALHQLRITPVSAGTSATIHDLGDRLVEAMQSGVARTRSGDRYKPSTVRAYRQTLDDHIYPELGGLPLSELRRRHVQDLVDGLVASGASASTVRNALMPLRVICRRAIRADELAVNPLDHLDLPTVRPTRDRAATPKDVADLLAALDEPDRALWATAFYSGLRRGELMALEFDAVELSTRRIQVRCSWDIKEGRVPPKSRAGARSVPMPEALAPILEDHLRRLAWTSGLVFGRSPTTPFDPSTVTERAYRAWRRAGLATYSLQEARHTYVTLLATSGLHVKAVSRFAGHASISITMDRYGHLLPGAHEEAANRLDVLLAASSNVP